jgi:DnaJ-class molecular chaperone
MAKAIFICGNCKGSGIEPEAWTSFVRYCSECRGKQYVYAEVF